LNEVESQFQSTAGSIAARVEIEFRQASERERMLAAEVQSSKTEFDNLNARSFEYQSLKREAESDKKLYEELLRRIQEATINSSFQNNAARIADPARPGQKPVFPNKPLNLILALLASSLLAVGIAILSDVLDDTVRDPEQVARSLGTQVVGSLPEVRPWRNQLPTLAPSAKGLSTYEEAIRTLRNSILLTDFDRRLKTMLVTSASPSEGKSTIAIHLAVAHAQQHLKTLVIDGDLRRPSVHKRFSLRNTHGLSDILLTGESWRNAIQSPQHVPDLDIIPAGSSNPRRAADLLGKRLEKILDEAAMDYDLIIVDAPPLLGFPEPLQMAATVDGVLVVARAGQTSRRAVGSVLATLNRLRASTIGLVLNEVTRSISHSYYYYGYYRKYYADNRATTVTEPR
jgi:capsular exopolysaccharide synthesis family protein